MLRSAYDNDPNVDQIDAADLAFPSMFVYMRVVWFITRPDAKAPSAGGARTRLGEPRAPAEVVSFGV